MNQENQIKTHAHLLFRRSPPLAAGHAEVDPQLPPIDDLVPQDLRSLLGAWDIQEIGMGKPTWLARSTIDSNPDIENIANVAEEFVQIPVGHFERHVANEESSARRVVLGASLRTGTRAGSMDLDGHASAVQDLLVLLNDGLLGRGGVFIFDESKTKGGKISTVLPNQPIAHSGHLPTT
jgi:hypothetical protein